MASAASPRSRDNTPTTSAWDKSVTEGAARPYLVSQRETATRASALPTPTAAWRARTADPDDAARCASRTGLVRVRPVRGRRLGLWRDRNRTIFEHGRFRYERGRRRGIGPGLGRCGW